jgi:aspartate-semialdehyde dehydrogenase
MANKLKVGVLGSTGMVGQRFVALLDAHPMFDVTAVAASPASAGKPYAEAVAGRWTLPTAIPAATAKLTVGDASNVAAMADQVDFVFCAVDMAKDATARLEEDYARAETPVVSNNSAHRWTPDVPMMIPEINADHAKVIEAQRRRLEQLRLVVGAGVDRDNRLDPEGAHVFDVLREIRHSRLDLVGPTGGIPSVP